jgi:hypothetical protein
MVDRNLEDEFTEEEIERRMNDSIRRALNTPPSLAKELVGKTERAQIQRESRESGLRSIRCRRER